MKHLLLVTAAILFSTILMGIDGCSKKEQTPAQVQEPAADVANEPMAEEMSPNEEAVDQQAAEEDANAEAESMEKQDAESGDDQAPAAEDAEDSETE